MNTAINSKETDYLDFFGLNHNPFPIAPDDDHFYISNQVSEILSEIIHGIVTRKGFMVLAGEVGLGKTTISRRLIKVLEKKNIETSLVLHTGYQNVELLKAINQDFGLNNSSLLFGDQMKLLNDFLLNKNRKGTNCTIIIDDAQNLSHKSFELVRMISNLEINQQKLVQILLIGQPELLQKLDSHRLRQLNSRIIIKKTTKPLTKEELKNYLLFKLSTSGNSGQVAIKQNAFSRIHKFSAGNLRQINILMDRCLYTALLYNTKQISGKIVKSAWKDILSYKKHGFQKPKWILTAAMLLLCVISSVMFTGFYMKLDNHSATNITEPLPEIRHLIKPQIKTVIEEKENSSLVKAESVVVNQGPAFNFLNAYKLDRYFEKFSMAMKIGNFQGITNTIYDETGYLLILLDNVPVTVRKKYNILSFQSRYDDRTSFMVFWEPSLRFSRFYYYYKGREIKKLQKILASLNLYSGKIDGIVGKYLMIALVLFQEKTGIPLTGFPDDRTIFLLNHMMKV